MAPRLSPSKLQFIHDMILSQSLTTPQMADATDCSERTVKNIRRNLRQFGNVHAPPNRVGRRRSITPLMLEALCEHLLEKPGLYLDEMAVFLWDEFQMLATTSSMRALLSKGWSKNPFNPSDTVVPESSLAFQLEHLSAQANELSGASHWHPSAGEMAPEGSLVCQDSCFPTNFYTLNGTGFRF